MNPAPTAYTLLGDFDFNDTTLDKSHVLNERGKKPKFAFGSKTIVKSKNLDFPGPGEYETD